MMAECDYDGGDCCLAEIDDLKCDECICHQDGSRHPTRRNQKSFFFSFQNS